MGDTKSDRFVLRHVAASLHVSHWFSTYTAYCAAIAISISFIYFIHYNKLGFFLSTLKSYCVDYALKWLIKKIAAINLTTL